MTTVARRSQTPLHRILQSQRESRPAGARLASWLARHDGLVAFVVYLGIALLWYRSVIAHMDANCACGLSDDPGDGAVAVWWLEWFVHALGSGLPLMHTTVMWTPTGLNMYGTTASLLYAVVSAPLTLIWGPIVPFNVTMILAPVLSGWAANRLCRQITGSVSASLVGGAAFGFSTYEIGHMVGHVNIAMMACPPLVALCVLRLLAGESSKRRFVIQVSALLLIQTFISVEVLFTMTIVGGLALAAALLTGDAAQRRGLIQKLPVLALPYLIAGLAASWYLLQVLGGATYAQGVGARYPTDLLAFVVPMPYTWLGGSAVTGISNRFWGGLAETTSYLGLPLVLIMGRYLWTRRHTQKAMILGILTILLGLWILGPALYVDGNAVMRLPYQLLAALPVFSSVLEGRVSVFLALVASVILASWLASPRRRRAVGWACAVVAVIFVMPNLINPSSHDVSSWTNPTFFRTTMYRRYLGRGTTVLPINWGATGESFMWQAEDHFYWNMANGYWMFPPPPGWRNHLTADLWWHPGTPRRGDGLLLKQMIIERHVSDVVVQDDSVAHWQNVITTAGLGHGERVGGITLYRVPEAWLSDARR